MCGIAGRVGEGCDEWEPVVAAMTASLAHRGPDGSGVLRLPGGAVLGHRRLAIIDLSPTGAQPMADATGRYTIVFNGEVYNFRELRSELAAMGWQFRGTSDTEVVLNALIQWGTAALQRFNGMFALGLWDSQERALLLARDIFGEKPLYYALPEGGIAFASELPALLRDPEVAARARRSPRAANHFLALGYILAPLTLYENVNKLEPASYLLFSHGQIIRHQRYWDYRRFLARVNHSPEEEIAEELGRLVERAVERRLVSDVPVGSLLSGGIDSGTVTAIASRLLPYPLQTFSVGFREASYDESRAAQRFAAMLGTRHHDVLVEATPQSIEAAVSTYDEPLSDTSLIPTCEVMRLASRHVKVVLSGDGADEIFAGYLTYRADRIKQHLDRLPGLVRRRLAQFMRHASEDPRTKVGLGFKLRQFGKGLGTGPWYAHYAWRELHEEFERVALLGPTHYEEVVASHPFFVFARYYEEAHELDPMSQHLYVDAKTWLADDILVKVDRASMRCGLESRLPFLDRELIEYAATIPATLKLRGRHTKHILKQAVRRQLPGETLRRPKSGFNAPVGQWLGLQGRNEFVLFNEWVARKWNLLS
jgi:asparagine synthase (glutamine-hydrolysing)